MFDFLRKNKKIIEDDKYQIRESIHGNFFYHVSLDNKPLCGAETTMTTLLSILTWGKVTHLNEKYCKECDKLFKKESESK